MNYTCLLAKCSSHNSGRSATTLRVLGRHRTRVILRLPSGVANVFARQALGFRLAGASVGLAALALCLTSFLTKGGEWTRISLGWPGEQIGNGLQRGFVGCFWMNKIKRTTILKLNYIVHICIPIYTNFYDKKCWVSREYPGTTPGPPMSIAIVLYFPYGS